MKKTTEELAQAIVLGVFAFIGTLVLWFAIFLGLTWVLITQLAVLGYDLPYWPVFWILFVLRIMFVSPKT